MEITITSDFVLIWDGATKKIIYSGPSGQKLWTDKQVFQAATQKEIDAKIAEEGLTPLFVTKQ